MIKTKKVFDLLIYWLSLYNLHHYYEIDVFIRYNERICFILIYLEYLYQYLSMINMMFVYCY